LRDLVIEFGRLHDWIAQSINPITQSPNHQITQSPDHQITRSPDHSMNVLVHRLRLLYCCCDVRKNGSTTRRRRAAETNAAAPTRRIVHWLLIFVASLIVVDGLVGDRGLLAILRARQEYDQLATTIGQLHAENARLRDQARRLKDDPATIEEVARRELGLIKPGERVFIIKDVPPAKP
jgi:cell division protein FtsB